MKFGGLVQQLVDQRFDVVPLVLDHAGRKDGIYQSAQSRVIGRVHVADPLADLVVEWLKLRLGILRQGVGVGLHSLARFQAGIIQCRVHVFVPRQHPRIEAG